MSVDASRISDIVVFAIVAATGFLSIGLGMFFLWQQLGPSCLAGIAIIIASIPLTKISSQWMGQIQKKLMSVKDDRVHINQEVLSNMRTIKLQAWEIPFLQKITNLRRLELHELLYYMIAQACTFLLFGSVPLLLALCTFAAYILIARQILDVASALTSLALFEILRFPLFMMPMVVNQLVEASISIRRIEEFLSAPDRIPPKQLLLLSSSRTSKNHNKASSLVSQSASVIVIKVTNASFTYQDISATTILGKKKKADASSQDRIPESKLPEKECLLPGTNPSSDNEEGKLLIRRLKDSSYGSTGFFRDDGEGGGETLPESLFLSLSLRQVNFECFEGEFIAVVGEVGSGKSTFLKALIGEVQNVSGDVAINGKLAYFDQSPFIMNDTVKGNILFGKSNFDEDLYQLAIRSCALEHDLTILPGGDQCEIGEKGITLSGGQKARIAMARVVYHNADISLLDDCLSAVDAHVGRHIFNECIVNVLLCHPKNNEQQQNSSSSGGGRKRKRTVILVTNALQYLKHPSVDRIVVLKDGAVAESGSYQELSAEEDSVFKSYVNTFNESMSGDSEDSSSENEGRLDDIGVSDLYSDDANADSSDEFDPSQLRKRRKSICDSTEGTSEKKSLMTDEMAERAVGKVGWDIYKSWAKAAGGYWVIILIVFVFAVGESLNVLSKWWLTRWSRSASEDVTSQTHYLGIYGIIIGAATIAQFFRMASVSWFSLKASKMMFASVLEQTLLAPMSFFDTTPIGRIMNRFSQDVFTLDELLPASFQKFADCMFTVISTFAVVISVTPVFSIVLIPLLYFYRKLQAQFTPCYRELKRIDSISRSPIYALFGETLEGPSTIRAFGAEASLLEHMIMRLDNQQRAYFLLQSGLVWLSLRLELIGTTIISFACLAAVWEKRMFPDGDEVFAGLAGLSISYALAVTMALNYAVRLGSEFEANVVAIERLRQYRNLDPEAPCETDAEKTLTTNWPSDGRIEFRNVKLRYRPGLPLVLKGLDLTIPARSKVGIVGRTGAGKSSIMVAMMRLVEVDAGSIFLDGVNAHTVGLRRLRSNIAVIPQDPVLFSGTIRSNLDPFGCFENSQMIDVLERVGLWSSETATSTVKSLKDSVSQNGSNFSVGQRQLLVIARALLDGARIVICDEATSSIDAGADSRIQKVLRTDFANATTLTVAHRLNTIMDSSHILVMSDGQAAEFDTPANLLSKEGLFKDLVDRWEDEHKAKKPSDAIDLERVYATDVP